jgi:hypothetical protein
MGAGNVLPKSAVLPTQQRALPVDGHVRGKTSDPRSLHKYAYANGIFLSSWRTVNH